MSSKVIHCIGKAPTAKVGIVRLFYAMNRREVWQEEIKAKKEGLIIATWSAQTKTGCRILGTTWTYESIQAYKIPKVKLITCPVCSGEGCQICNWAGKTTKQWLSGFQDWQLKPRSA